MEDPPFLGWGYASHSGIPVPREYFIQWHDLTAMEQRPEGPGGEGRAGWRHLDGGTGGRAREGEGGLGSPRRVRERVPGLLWGAGHVLRRDAEGRGADLPADVHRHLREDRLCQALRWQDSSDYADLLNDCV